MIHASRKAHQVEDREWHPKSGEQQMLMQEGAEGYVVMGMGRRAGEGGWEVCWGDAGKVGWEVTSQDTWMALAASLRTTMEGALCVLGLRTKTPIGPTGPAIDVFSWDIRPYRKALNLLAPGVLSGHTLAQ